MVTKRITDGQLDDLLTELGFTRQRVPRSGSAMSTPTPIP